MSGRSGATVVPTITKLWHAGSLPVSVTGNVVDFPVPPTVAGQPMGGGSGSVSLTRHFLSM
jgi:hypothetical protein